MKSNTESLHSQYTSRWGLITEDVHTPFAIMKNVPEEANDIHESGPLRAVRRLGMRNPGDCISRNGLVHSPKVSLFDLIS